MRRRTKARIWALQILYAHEITRAPLPQTCESFFARRKANKEKKAYTQRILDCFENNREAIDRVIEESVANWRIERLSLIDKNILRISICELLHMPDIPAKASINEAIVLSHWFGGDDSPRFVNGVLDSIFHQALKAR